MSHNFVEIRDLFEHWYARSKQVAPVRIAKMTRGSLIEKFAEFGLTKGAEIGVDRGSFSLYMCKKIEGLELLCVDPWRERQRGQERYETTKKKLAPYNVTLARTTSVLASLEVEDESLDFVYIDGDHTFDSVMLDIILWTRKVRFGGVVSGHDYYRFRRAGIVPAVDVFTQQHGISEWFLTDEKEATFFWARQPHFVDPLRFEGSLTDDTEDGAWKKAIA